MILRVRQPDGTNRDSENVPAPARMHRDRFALGGVLVTGTGPARDNPDQRAKWQQEYRRSQMAEAARRYRERQRGVA